MKNLIYIFILIFTLFKVEGQTNVSKPNKYNWNHIVSENEKVKLLSNKTVYVTGETLYFKVYVLSNNGYSGISKQSYVYLYSPGNKKIKQIKLSVKNGISYGDFIIPSNVKTGNYKLVAVTRHSQNKSVIKSGIVDVFIINPYNNAKAEVKNKDTILIHKLNMLPLAKEHFSKRQKISYDLKKLGIYEKGNYVVNVQKVDSLQWEKPKENIIDNLPIPNFIPEVRGELVSGKVVDNKNNAVVNKIISLSITNNPTLFKNVETNKQGEFYFNLYENYKSGNLVLNLIDKNIKDSVAVLLNEKKLSFKDRLQFYNLSFQDDIKNWIESQSLYTQIENIYFNRKRDSILPKNTVSKIYGENYNKYVLSDYTRFETMQETFIEIILKAYVRIKKETPKFYVRLPDKLDFFNVKLDPLILIDGNQIIDHKILYNFDPYQIKQINVVDDLYFYGSNVYRGVIDVQTTKGNFELKKKQVNYKNNFPAPFPDKIYYQPDYMNKKTVLKHIPDFRTQLYWNPNVSEKQSDISFYTSDVPGLFKIKMDGYTENGKYILVEKYFVVE